MFLVVALGGNALLRRGQPLDIETQRENARTAARVVADLVRDHDVLLTHGNGPQVGLLALQSAAGVEVPATPLDVLGAESEGMIGYLLEQELENVLDGREVASLLTQVVVDSDDPAFRAPTKPIGPVSPRSKRACSRRHAAGPSRRTATAGDGRCRPLGRNRSSDSELLRSCSISGWW